MSFNDLDTSHESVPYENPLFSMRIFTVFFEQSADCKLFPWHYHQEVELLAILDGAMQIETKNRIYDLKAGDLLVMGSNEVHRSRKKEQVKYVVLQMDPVPFFNSGTVMYSKTFSSVIRPLSEINYLWSENRVIREEAFQLICFMQEEMNRRDRGYELGVSGAVKRILFLMVRFDTRNVVRIADSLSLNRLQPALDHVETRLGETIELAEVSSLVNFSYHYFMKLFKRTMGMSFTEYVQLKRIRKAECMLLTEELSVTVISGLVGFETPAQFYKLFRRYNGVAPREFVRSRKQSNLGAEMVESTDQTVN